MSLNIPLALYLLSEPASPRHCWCLLGGDCDCGPPPGARYATLLPWCPPLTFPTDHCVPPTDPGVPPSGSPSVPPTDQCPPSIVAPVSHSVSHSAHSRFLQLAEQSELLEQIQSRPLWTDTRSRAVYENIVGTSDHLRSSSRGDGVRLGQCCDVMQI